jgi:energy-coupling factor transporter transmembrane protein EcfT
MKREGEFMHSWYVLIVTFFSLLFMLINPEYKLNLLLCFFILTLYFKNGLKPAQFSRVLFYALFFSFSIFLLNVLYPAVALKQGKVYEFFSFLIYEASLEKGLRTFIKLFLVSLLSMSSVFAIDYTKVILHLLVHKGLKLFWGYPLLLAMNSIVLFKEEFERIKINASLRELPWRDRFSLIFPLLVFAIRHSQRGALSLVTRGLNEKKSFYFTYDLSSVDRLYLVFFWCLYFTLVSLAIIPLR